MSGTARTLSTSRRWRTALRAGALAAALAVVAGVPLAAEAHDWDHGWRGHEWREHAWREHERFAPRYAYAAPVYRYAPAYVAPAPAYVSPWFNFGFTIR